MFKIFPLFLTLLFFGLMNVSSALAFDPVAPRSDRPFGFLKVDTPLPQSDLCEITSINGVKYGYHLAFRPGEMIQVPIGEYELKVKLQDGEWTSPITVTSTEFTNVVVPGYGNLKVQAPHPWDMVEVYSRDGQLLKRFPASKVKTMPIGIYDVRVTMESDLANRGNVTVNTMIASKHNVMIAPNTTRELIVQF
jgi:hypothetical protein